MRLKQKGWGFDPHSQCCVLEQDLIGVNTFHDFDSGKQRSFYTFRNRNRGGGVAVADPEGVQGGSKKYRNTPKHRNTLITNSNHRNTLWILAMGKGSPTI